MSQEKQNKLAEFYNKMDVLLERLSWMNEPSEQDRRDGIDSIMKSWLSLGTAERMNEAYRAKYAAELSLSISLTFEGGLQKSLLPKKCPERLLTGKKTDAASDYSTIVITDADLDNHKDPYFQKVKISYPKEIERFQKSHEADLLPLDIYGIADFCGSFSLLSHKQSRVYIHQKALDVMIAYAQDVFKQKPIWLQEEYGQEYDSVDQDSLDKLEKESEILSPSTMSTNLAKHVMLKAAALNLQNI